VAVDIEEAGSIGLLVDQVVVPDLVVEGAGLGHWVSRLSKVGVYLEACAAEEKCLEGASRVPMRRAGITA
jgi:hypothetical protein